MSRINYVSNICDAVMYILKNLKKSVHKRTVKVACAALPMLTGRGHINKDNNNNKLMHFHNVPGLKKKKKKKKDLLLNQMGYATRFVEYYERLAADKGL